ncbi:MAG: adenylosuccinate lyase [Bdellovibrionaceae bacterium]|nr:adenylosuccinate lyase [Pseudobdellovibrionaceae bacterium]|tara:strand:- start:1251 stop:2564 length:1314 start_codon:yes stop_codon:yes gene_type:complete
MIERYTRLEMADIWSDQNRLNLWLQIELEVCRGLAQKKIIPQKEWLILEKKMTALLHSGGVSPRRVAQIEKKLKHDVIAFTTAVAEKVGPTSRYIHFGLTSSDVIDTATSIQIQNAGKEILSDIRMLRKALKKKAIRYKKLPALGRSHGIFAEPMAFGMKFLSSYAEWTRNEQRLTEALERMRTGQFSGAIGVTPHWSPAFETKILKRLGLKREKISTQVIPRDHHAEFLSVLALCGDALERMSVEIRHLQRTEVAEVREGFSSGQKGSSAMPHKRNPISSENLTGCARLLRSYAQAAHENVSLWHERDISHSSVERVVLPDATIIADYGIRRMTQVIDRLEVLSDRVKQNLNRVGQTVYSGHFLMKLVEKGASREDAYYWIQQAAIADVDGKKEFIQGMIDDSRVRRFLSEKEIKKLGSLDYQLRHVDQIYHEVFN